MEKKLVKVRKPKEKEEYVFKKTHFMKAKRIILWGILIYFFLRGIATTFRPDETNEVTRMISQFRTDFSNYRDQDAEVMSFAQNFAREYLTYKNKDEEDYKNRIANYLPSSITNINTTEIVDLNGEAEAIYVQAYRKEDITAKQCNVYVRAIVNYVVPVPGDNSKDTGDNGQVRTTEEQKEVILKVPVYFYGNTYMVEDLPMYVNDNMKDPSYTTKQFEGNTITDDSVVDNIKDSLSNFFKAYYEQDQSVINYYLTKDADTSKFIGLGGSLQFGEIYDLKCYQMKKGILCIVKIKAQDSINGVSISQNQNVVVVKNGDMYYVSDMDTKTQNLREANN